MLKSANCLPEEVTLRNDLARLARARASASDAGECQRLAQQIADRSLRLNLLIERATRPRAR
ncbi:MAG: hypothetical protein ACRD1V_17385 [Vicinamibacterales bacterium]